MYYQKSQLLPNWQTEIISSVMVLMCLFLVSLFPAQDDLQYFSLYFFALFLLPVLYIKFILKKNLVDFGFNLRNKTMGFSWALGMLIVSFLIIFALMHLFDFEQKYPLPQYLSKSFWLFLFYELVLVNFIYFINEFFFRGFFLALFAKKLGLSSFIIQALVFIVFLLQSESVDWSLAPLIILSFTGGLVAYKSDSFIYSYLMSLVFILFLDAYIIYLFK